MRVMPPGTMHRVRVAMAAVAAAAVLASAAPGTRAGHPAPPDLRGVPAKAAALERLHSLLVSWRGERLVEHYARGFSATRHANIKSAAKSVVSVLVGVAVDRGLVRSVDDPIGGYLPQLARMPAEKRAITVEDLLTMRSGLESVSGPGYGPWVRSRNWVQYALDRPLVSAPGTSMEYSTGTSHLLSAILTRASGKSTWALAQEAIGGPIGITFARWTRDPQGIYMGGNEMLMTPRQMLAFGEMFENGGMARSGRRVVSDSWVTTSCRPRTRSRWDPTREYGYGWWIQDVGSARACFAWGHGGQYILTFRDLDLVVVATSSTTASEDRHDYRERLLDLVAREIVEPFTRGARATR
jgi:CubicO group peptidase (beta-lactamase class C family)